MPYQLSSPTPGVQSSGDGIVQGADGPREPPVGRPAGPSRDGCATVVGDRGQNVRVHLAITLVALIATVLAGTAVADRLKIPAPLFLIVVGAIGCYLPFVPQIHLEPEVVLVGLLPPLLYSAAIQTSLVDFAANRGSILLLSVGLVVATTFTVGAAGTGCCPIWAGRRPWRSARSSRPRMPSPPPRSADASGCHGAS